MLDEIPDDAGIVVIVGHNPSIGELAAALDDGEGDAAGASGPRAGSRPAPSRCSTCPGRSPASHPEDATLTEVAVPGADGRGRSAERLAAPQGSPLDAASSVSLVGSGPRREDRRAPPPATRNGFPLSSTVTTPSRPAELYRTSNTHDTRSDPA